MSAHLDLASPTEPALRAAPAPGATVYTRDRDLWFHDGSLVVLAGGGGRDGAAQTVGFRVHQSLLARHSAVFADMLAQAAPDAQHRIEGCPVTRMPDAVRDVDHLLHALYDPNYVPEDTLDVISSRQWEILASVLRMSTKYNVPRLRAKILRILAVYWPSTLDAFDKSFRCIAASACAAVAIELAQQVAAPQLLPGAYYRAATVPPKVLPGLLSMTPNPLSALDLRRLLLGKEALRTAMRTLTCPFFLDLRAPGALAATCTVEGGGAACKTALMQFALLLHESGWLDAPDALGNRLPELINARAGGACGECKAHCLDQLERGRAEVWERLPGFFQLPPWEELLQGREEDGASEA